MSTHSLEGKKIIVTGGSRGIGAGIVKYLASKGASVYFSYSSNKESAEALLKDLPGSGHQCFQLNISDSENVESSFKQILGEMGQVDGLVNNAGITADQLLMRMKEDDFNRVLTTNLTGSFLCIKMVLKPMMKARKGSVVNITSVVGQMGNAGQANYAASKAGIDGLTKSAALEVASRNIRFNCVAPGFINTDMTGALDDNQKQQMFDRIPMGRIGDVDDVASAVAFLLGDESHYITGQTIAVNGGMYM
ncbi:MAG: beta-ketoacyl-ACP reductase [Bdellovibrionaceae bacterium]|nr:beta-ketoacyl-ACP reductase [Pseudobdellovibrionaceae bacterium]|tara:strand:- start:124 stop:870 length:747 start_codon:yes stop_codon:yes gene_type:complete